ncbi:hypothetical protein OOJ96_13355 [Pseudomonas sp. 15FMM2]|uniref:Uncharacterized protein n=1 Tax=Pseudomonas imrae TaxID=2992837 RepID=A0ACC7PI85_9PSED
MSNVTPHAPAAYNYFERRCDEQLETKNRSGNSSRGESNSTGMARAGDAWRQPYSLFDRDRPERDGQIGNLIDVQRQNNRLNQSLVTVLGQLSTVLTSMLKNFKPDNANSVVTDKTKVDAEKSEFGKLLSNALNTITPTENKLFQRLEGQMNRRRDGRNPLTQEERVAVEKFEVIERELKKRLDKNHHEIIRDVLPYDTTDLEAILTRGGGGTRREGEVVHKMYEGTPMTLEEQMIALKLHLLGF